MLNGDLLDASRWTIVLLGICEFQLGAICYREFRIVFEQFYVSEFIANDKARHADCRKLKSRARLYLEHLKEEMDTSNLSWTTWTLL
jgi:hypothetical protein